jgi:long-chain-fatty-acid--[acyl-carrier-protein] ligase
MNILTYFLYLLVKTFIPLRYRVRIQGFDECLAKGRKGILFLPNHPALIDPIILNAILFHRFRPRALADEKQIRQTVLKHLQKSLRMLPLPDIGIAGKAGHEKVIRQIGVCADALRQGDNLLFYPAGRIYRSRFEKLRGNGGVARILESYPEVRIVLVRTRGLWGSSFSRGKGYQTPFTETLFSHVKHLLANAIFFGPRREVTIEFHELPTDFPRSADKEVINRWLEDFYNEDAPVNTYVPYGWWERGGPRHVPEPETTNSPVNTRNVPEEVRRVVYDKLHEITNKRILKETDTLGTDLALDSLMVAELQAWIQDEFGHVVNNPETLRTVGSLLLAAIGESSSIEPLLPIPPKWFVKDDDSLLEPPGGERVTDIFLRHAAARPDFVLLGDQARGIFSHRKIILRIMALRPALAALPGDRLGILMPACAAVNIVYLATLFAGKIPVMINWTVGLRNMRHCLDNAGVRHIITSSLVIERLEGRGTDFTGVKESFLYLEDIGARISLPQKIGALLASRFCWRSLRRAPVPELAAILFTSGSENLPKTVPLTHRNVITNVASAMQALGLRQDDCSIGMLPPFHSFGLLMGCLMPALASLRIVYHANPTEGNMLARLIAAYRITMVVGTPTFIGNILRNATEAQMQSLRMAISGAEKCPDATAALFLEKCPQAVFLEGYGITECSPVVALNEQFSPRAGTIGKIINCLEWIVTDEQNQPVPPGQTGMLHLRGPSIFGGYLNYDGPSPFVTIQGKEWYRTGDLVAADQDGYITFKGRLKRFVKIGGEMISLPAIEEILLDIHRTEEMPLPLAVEAIGTEEQPNITLFTVLDLNRETVNHQLREAGLSPIHGIRNIVKVMEIPLLGTGKTNYRALKAMAAGAADAAAGTPPPVTAHAHQA